MKIILNHTPETLPADISTISKLLSYKNFSFPRIVVKINGTLIRKDEYPEAIIREDDQVEIIHLISGG